MSPHLVACVALATVLAACERPGERRAERELAAEALRGLVAYPRSSVVSVAAGAEAAQVVLTTPAPLERVASALTNRYPLSSAPVETSER